MTIDLTDADRAAITAATVKYNQDWDGPLYAEYCYRAGLAAGRERAIEECAEVAMSYEPKCDTCPSGVTLAIQRLKERRG